jgi:hypothetical protein
MIWGLTQGKVQVKSGLTVDPGQQKIKVVIIILLKFDLGLNPGQGLGHGSRGSAWVIVRIKVVIIIVLKPDLGVNRGKA